MGIKPVALFAVCVILSGCASDGVRLTLHSVPEGALVIQQGSVLGRTPTILTYDTEDAFDQGRCLRINPLTARWASGAYATWNGKLCPNLGENQQYTFSRPIGAPGEATDARIAAQIAQMQVIRQVQAAAEQAQTREANYEALRQAAGTLGSYIGSGGKGVTPPPSQSNTYTYPTNNKSNDKVTCTSEREPFGTGVKTVCH